MEVVELECDWAVVVVVGDSWNVVVVNRNVGRVVGGYVSSVVGGT